MPITWPRLSIMTGIQPEPGASEDPGGKRR
jgi:hypothetical protein